MHKTNLIVVCLFSLLATEVLLGATSKTEVSHRMTKKLGFGLSFDQPAPTVLGVNAYYNLNDMLRATVGFGSISTTTSITITGTGIETEEASAKTVGAGIVGMIPGWNITPTVGLHAAYIAYSGNGMRVGNFDSSGGHVYGTLGVDWQASSGFNASLGYRQSFRSGIGGGVYLGAGWFFDWIG